MAPASPTTAFVFLLISMVFWGSWSNTLKYSKAPRFELYYWDFVVGALITGTVLGLIFGNYSYAYVQKIFHAEFRYVIQAFLSGVLFNIANILLVASITMSTIVFSYLMCFSATLIVDSLMRYVLDTHPNTYSLFFGILALLIGIFCSISAAKRLHHKKDVLKRVISITLFSGLMLGLFYPLLGKSLDIPDHERLGPYISFFFFSIGLFACNLIVNWFFMRNPLFSHPLSYQDYRGITWKNHILAWLGGGIWAAAMCFRLLAGGKVDPLWIFICIQVVALIATAWGFFLWKEYPKESGSRPFLSCGIIAYTIGIILIGISEYS